MVSRLEVVSAYRSILGREPESEDAVNLWMQAESLEHLISSMINTEEFLEQNGYKSGYRLIKFYDLDVAIPKNDWMLDYVSDNASYEPYVMEHFIKSIRKTSVVLDVGANIGLYSVVASKFAKSVISVEASHDNAKFIIYNCALNNITNVEVIPLAASDVVGVKTFQKTKDSNKVLSRSGIDEKVYNSFDITAGIPLDLMVGKKKVDVIKIDIEGHEYLAIKGAKKILMSRPIVFTEFSPLFLKNGSGIEYHKYLDLFTGNGYLIKIMHRDGTLQSMDDYEAVISAWQTYMENNVTHLDLMMVPPSVT